MCQCPTILTEKTFFLISNLTPPSSNVKLCPDTNCPCNQFFSTSLTDFRYWEDFSTPIRSPLLQTKQSQFPQLFLTAEVPQPCDPFHGLLWTGSTSLPCWGARAGCSRAGGSQESRVNPHPTYHTLHRTCSPRGGVKPLITTKKEKIRR